MTVYAQALHAALYGLPAHDESLPTALDALLQATHTATAPEQKTAVLRQVAEQLRNAAEIIQRYQYRAQWDRFPADVAEQLADAHDQAQQIAQALDRVAPPSATSPPRTRGPVPRPTTPGAPPPQRPPRLHRPHANADLRRLPALRERHLLATTNSLHALLARPRCALGVFVPAGLHPARAERHQLDQIARPAPN
ncbi:hypothetical protein ACH4NS_17285 [Streptomyces mutabilis]|uniref:hypothetical protein n=1 Tax=Streptomyces mutabilis TaxID=67332 RepID=UPI00378D3CFA